MKLPNRTHRNIAIALLATTCLLAIAPAAQAGHSNGWRRYKGVDRPYRNDRYVQRVVVRDSGAGPALAGLIGGFILGTAVSRSAPPVVVHEHAYVEAPRYRYYDPYCDEWFASLGQCREHCFDYRHPRIVRVYNGYGGECVRTLRWSDGAWYDYDDDRDWDD